MLLLNQQMVQNGWVSTVQYIIFKRCIMSKFTSKFQWHFQVIPYSPSDCVDLNNHRDAFQWNFKIICRKSFTLHCHQQQRVTHYRRVTKNSLSRPNRIIFFPLSYWKVSKYSFYGLVLQSIWFYVWKIKLVFIGVAIEWWGGVGDSTNVLWMYIYFPFYNNQQLRTARVFIICVYFCFSNIIRCSQWKMFLKMWFIFSGFPLRYTC